jgi:PadR family transcriptional regulator, regulatory protein PadR
MDQKISKELQTYAITVLIFKLLKNDASYGYKLIKDVESMTNSMVQIEEGYLYPVLAKWKKAGYIDYNWEMTTGNQRRKKYKLSAAGNVFLNRLLSEAKEIETLYGK